MVDEQVYTFMPTETSVFNITSMWCNSGEYSVLCNYEIAPLWNRGTRNIYGQYRPVAWYGLYWFIIDGECKGCHRWFDLYDKFIDKIHFMSDGSAICKYCLRSYLTEHNLVSVYNLANDAGVSGVTDHIMHNAIGFANTKYGF